MIRPVGSHELISALLKGGFRPRGKSGGGSHLVYKKTTSEGTRNVVVVLNKKEIPIGTLKSVLRQAGITEEQLFKLLE
jgi:predicted RNA binding protein YcfA (HicA-like mRNA interferase family)